MKRIPMFMVGLACVGMLACDRSARNEVNDPNAVGTAGNAAGAGDRAFVQDMSEAGMAEVELGNLAAQRATNPEVKRFAETMVRDHTKAGEELKQIATTHSISMASSIRDEHRELMSRLTPLRGAEFDREYMKAMVEGHEDVVDRLQTRASEDRFGENKGTVRPERSDNPAEADLNQWAANTLPVARQHLEEAERISETLTTGTQTRN
jgi:putative membrane protein